VERLFSGQFRTSNAERRGHWDLTSGLVQNFPRENTDGSLCHTRIRWTNAAYIFAAAATGICLFCGTGSLPVGRRPLAR